MSEDDRRVHVDTTDQAGGPPPSRAATLLSRLTSPVVSAVLLALICGVVGITAWLQRTDWFIDLGVYRAGGQAWLDAAPLYEHAFPTVHPAVWLPFIYPPFAAMVFVVLTVVPAAVLVVAFSLGSVAALLITVRAVGAAVHPGFGWPHAVLFGGLALVLEPVWQTLSLGQINLYLMAMVVVDLLAVRSERRRGLLVGLAAAVKLTPAVFVLFLLAGRQWRAVANAAVAFGAVTVLALLVRPSESVTYWWRALGAPTQIGDLGYAGNQSVRGALHRLGWSHVVELTCWLSVVVLVLVLTGLALRRWRAAGLGARPGDRAAAVPAQAVPSGPAAMVMVGLAGVLISPISWSHHWVWLVPALLVLGQAAVRRRSVPLGVTAALIVPVTVFPTHRLLPMEHHRELGWTLTQHLVGDTYLWLGLLLLPVLYRLSRVAGPWPVGAALEPGKRAG